MPGGWKATGGNLTTPAGKKPAGTLLPGARVCPRSGVAIDHVHDLLVGRIHDEDLVRKPGVPIGLQGRELAGNLSRDRAKPDIAGNRRPRRCSEIRRFALTCTPTEVAPGQLFLGGCKREDLSFAIDAVEDIADDFDIALCLGCRGCSDAACQGDGCEGYEDKRRNFMTVLLIEPPPGTTVNWSMSFVKQF